VFWPVIEGLMAPRGELKSKVVYEGVEAEG
jgi:hypothetical protein